LLNIEQKLRSCQLVSCGSADIYLQFAEFYTTYFTLYRSVSWLAISADRESSMRIVFWLACH